MTIATTGFDPRLEAYADTRQRVRLAEVWANHRPDPVTGNCIRCKQTREAIEDLRITDCLPSVTIKNTSGITPLDVRVLVKPDPAGEKVGNIFLPDSVKEQDKFAQMKGTLIAVGENAWCEAKNGATFTAPEPGARVLIGKYSGIRVKGNDADDYLIMNDADITGLLEG